MSKPRMTLAALSARVDASEARFDRLEALLVTLVERSEPAKRVTTHTKAPAQPTRLQKAGRGTPKKVTPAKAPAKRDLTKTELGRKGWNDTFIAEVRLSGLRDARGISLYRVSQNLWTQVAKMRDDGMTPANAMASVMGNKAWTDRKGNVYA